MIFQEQTDYSVSPSHVLSIGIDQIADMLYVAYTIQLRGQFVSVGFLGVAPGHRRRAEA
jgi:hypothetical protein